MSRKLKDTANMTQWSELAVEPSASSSVCYLTDKNDN